LPTRTSHFLLCWAQIPPGAASCSFTVFMLPSGHVVKMKELPLLNLSLLRSYAELKSFLFDGFFPSFPFPVSPLLLWARHRPPPSSTSGRRLTSFPPRNRPTLFFKLNPFLKSGPFLLPPPLSFLPPPFLYVKIGHDPPLTTLFVKSFSTPTPPCTHCSRMPSPSSFSHPFSSSASKAFSMTLFFFSIRQQFFTSTLF